MAKFLLTGARAPVTLELLRNLSRHGHEVYLADSMLYPMAKNSRYLQHYFYIPSPKNNIQTYQNSLLQIIKEHKIDYLLPSCEEVFFIAYIKNSLSSYTTVLCDRFEFLAKLHSKIQILYLAKDCGISLPKTKLVDALYLSSNDHLLTDSIVKKEFCRFGVDVILKPNQKNITKLIKSSNKADRYLVQQKIIGQEYCTYSIAHKGQLNLHICYQPMHRVHQSASLYFSPVEHEQILCFVRSFVAKHHFSGQIGFDFIEDKNTLYLIECNPRATSGLHLASSNDIASCFLNTLPTYLKPRQQPVMISLAMLLIGLPNALVSFSLGKWIKDYRTAKDVICVKDDKSFLWFQFLSLFELFYRAFRDSTSVRAASTEDTEWDGEEIK